MDCEWASSQQNCQLTTCIDGDRLHINIAIGQKDNKKQYQVQLGNIKDIKQLAEWFDTLSDVAQHLKNTNSYEINLEKETLNIRGKHPTKSLSFLHIATLKLQPKNSNIGQDIFKQAIKKCGDDNYKLTNNDIKSIITLIIQKLEQIQTKKNKTPQNNTINELKQQIEKRMFNSQFEIGRLNQKLAEEIQKVREEISQSLEKSVVENYYASEIKNSDEVMQKRSSSLLKLEQDLKNKDEIIDIIINKMNQGFQERDLRMDKIQNIIQANENKFKELSQKTEKIVNHNEALNFVDPQCASFRRISIIGKSIIKQRGQQADIFSIIPIKRKNSFTLRIEELKGVICIGVVDANLKTKKSFVNVPNCVVYYNDGNFYNGLGMKGRMVKGFQVGDLVTTTVNLDVGKIQWRVDNQIRLTYNYDRLQDPSINWVPYFWILQNGDGVSIIE